VAEKYETAEAKQSIRQAMLAAVWQIDPDDETDTSIELTLWKGSAQRYLDACSGLAD